MRTFSQSVCTHQLSSLQVHKVPSLSEQHRQGSHKIPIHTNQRPQVATFRLVPCPTLPGTISTLFFLVTTTWKEGITFILGQKTARMVGAVSCPRQKREKHCGCASAGRQVRSRKPSQWSRRRSAQPRLMHVHPCCRLQPERLNPDPPTQGEALCSAGRRIKPREPSRWSRQRSARPRLAHVHPHNTFRTG